MSSYINIELDTTSPIVNIYAPNQTTILTDTLYRIEANEKLANIQDFYFIDSRGIKHHIDLQYFYQYFEGTVSFQGFATGLATLFVKVWDEVMNQSRLYKHTVNVLETRGLILRINEETRKVIVAVKSRNKLEINEEVIP